MLLYHKKGEDKSYMVTFIKVGAIIYLPGEKRQKALTD